MKNANSDPISILELGWVTDVQTHTESDDFNNYTCDVTLRDTRQTLYKVPIATHFIGFMAPPAVGDLVLVLYQKGGIHSPFVIGRLYTESPRQPITKMGELRLIVGNRQIYFSEDGALTIHRSDKDSGNPNASIRIEPDNQINIYSDNDISFTSQTKIKMEAPEIEINASQDVNIYAAKTVEIAAGVYANIQGLLTTVSGFLATSVIGLWTTVTGWRSTTVEAWGDDVEISTGFPDDLISMGIGKLAGALNMRRGGGDIKLESKKNIMLESPEEIFFAGKEGIYLSSNGSVQASGDYIDLFASNSIACTAGKVGIFGKNQCWVSGGGGKALLDGSGVKLKGAKVDTNFAGGIADGYKTVKMDWDTITSDMETASGSHKLLKGPKWAVAKNCMQTWMALPEYFDMGYNLLAFTGDSNVWKTLSVDFLTGFFQDPYEEWIKEEEDTKVGFPDYLDRMSGFLGPGAGYYSASPPDTATVEGKLKTALDGFLQHIHTQYGLKIPDQTVFDVYERYFRNTFGRITREKHAPDPDVAITQDHIGEIKDRFLEDFTFDISLFQQYCRDLKGDLSIDFANTILDGMTDEDTADTDMNLYAIVEGLLQQIDGDDPAVGFTGEPYKAQLNDHKGILRIDVEFALKNPDENLLYNEVNHEPVIKRETGEVNRSAVLNALKGVVLDHLGDYKIYRPPPPPVGEDAVEPSEPGEA
jgi:uncharacterized protein (DUF2345 family)